MRTTSASGSRSPIVMAWSRYTRTCQAWRSTLAIRSSRARRLAWSAAPVFPSARISTYSSRWGVCQPIQLRSSAVDNSGGEQYRLSDAFLDPGPRTVGVLQHLTHSLFGHGQARGDRSLRDAQRLGDRAVGVAVVVPEHDHRGLLWRQLGERCHQVAVLREHLRIGSDARAADASNHLPDLAKAHLALVRDSSVDRDAMHPRLCGSDWLPGGPLLVRALESVLGAVLGGCSVTEQRGKGAQDLAIGRLVQTLEVRFVSRLVIVGERAGAGRR